MAHHRLIPLSLALATAACLASCLSACSSRGDARPTSVDSTSSAPPVAPPTMADARPHDFAGLHNVVAFHDGYLSGSVPRGDAGFETLAAMGVKTIISVDGALPDVAGAKRRGIRYVHLPIGYDGFDERRRLELTRASRDAMREGPVYVHCHHGKHRSAGAAAAVAVGLGWSSPEASVGRMKIAGTAPTYTGLYACALAATALRPSEIDAVSAEFPEVSLPTSFVQGMIDADAALEHLQALERAGWAVPADHPDLVPAAEARRLADLLRVMADGDHGQPRPADFAAALRKNGVLAQHLEDRLAAGETDPTVLSGRLRLVIASCKDCHIKHRDN